MDGTCSFGTEFPIGKVLTLKCLLVDRLATACYVRRLEKCPASSLRASGPASFKFPPSHNQRLKGSRSLKEGGQKNLVTARKVPLEVLRMECVRVRTQRPFPRGLKSAQGQVHSLKQARGDCSSRFSRISVMTSSLPFAGPFVKYSTFSLP